MLEIVRPEGLHERHYHPYDHENCRCTRFAVSSVLKLYQFFSTICSIFAALREMFRAKAGQGYECISEEVASDIQVPPNDVIKTEVETSEHAPAPTSLMALSDADDEFFDVPEPSDDEGECPESCYVVVFPSKVQFFSFNFVMFICLQI